MQNFFWYPLVGTVLTFSLVPLNQFGIISSLQFRFVNAASLIFSYSFLSIFIYKFTGKGKYFLALIFALLTVVITLIWLDLFVYKKSMFAFSFAYGCLFCYSLFYFYTIFIQKQKQNLSNNPAFFVCCGIFLGTGFIIPFHYFVYYLQKINVDIKLINGLISFSGFGFIVMNLFFIKALLCKTVSK